MSLFSKENFVYCDFLGAYALNFVLTILHRCVACFKKEEHHDPSVLVIYLTIFSRLFAALALLGVAIWGTLIIASKFIT